MLLSVFSCGYIIISLLYPCPLSLSASLNIVEDHPYIIIVSLLVSLKNLLLTIESKNLYWTFGW